jgi:hypothetical protein
LEITSIPTKIASTKIVSQISGSVVNCIAPRIWSSTSLHHETPAQHESHTSQM